MASVSTDKTGRRTVYVVCPEGMRRSVRLGKVTKSQADQARRMVESLVASAAMVSPIDQRAAEWLAALADAVHERIAKCGLCPARNIAAASEWPDTVAAFVERYVASRTDAKKSTRSALKRGASALREFFWLAAPIADVTEGQALEFFRWLRDDDGRGYAENTARRTCGMARQFWREACGTS